MLDVKTVRITVDGAMRVDVFKLVDFHDSKFIQNRGNPEDAAEKNKAKSRVRRPLF